MSKIIKSQEEILAKLNIAALNPMQQAVISATASNNEIVLLSPTGTGKTLAFLLPMIAHLDEHCMEIQALIIVPSRELAIQIEQVARDMGTGFKVNAVYGGRSGSKDRVEIKHRPAILVGTPGRVADHLRRSSFELGKIKTVVLDEFDKSLEVGFEAEMNEIFNFLPNLNKKILTSATKGVDIPDFVRLRKPKTIDYLNTATNNLTLKLVMSPVKDKLETLTALISQLGGQNGIVFCNFKDSIQRVSDHLTKHNIDHGTFYGGLEQGERERALIKFRNGTYQLLLATDLAARGIDVPSLSYIIHYHLPVKSEEFTHRNGRTARMNEEGVAYVLQYEKEELPEFIGSVPIEQLNPASVPVASPWCTLFISGGRKDKVSKGDIAGLFFKQGNLAKDQLGKIELKNDCAFVAVHKSTLAELLPKVNNTKLKKKKIRVILI